MLVDAQIERLYNSFKDIPSARDSALKRAAACAPRIERPTRSLLRNANCHDMKTQVSSVFSSLDYQVQGSQNAGVRRCQNAQVPKQQK